MDEDIDPGGVMRFSPHAPKKPHHKYQHLYAWFLYGLMSLIWVTTKDFKQIYRYEKQGLFQTQNTTFKKEFIRMVIYKVIYYGYIIVLPLALGLSPWLVFGGWLLMHFVCGFMLGIIFQPAHVMETSEFPKPEDPAEILRQGWAEHQLRTTTNFAPKSKWFTWYVGGLNFQIEHHLFPNICHVHYHKISDIVKKTAREYGIPYNEHKTFLSALIEHGRMLKKLGT
jgi:linoleoyl-CoA desaturase